MSSDPLELLRVEIDQIDSELLALLKSRFEVCRKIALYKRHAAIPMMQAGRVQQVKENTRHLAASHGIDENFISAIYDLIIAEACRLEDRIIEENGPDTADAERRIRNGLSSFLILGANGQVGRWLSRKLSQTGANVTGIDLDPTPAKDGEYSAYVSADLTVGENGALAAMQQATCIVVCLPETAALAALPNILKNISRGGLLVDSLSVKTTYLSEVAAAGKEIECLSMNPMFSPTLDCKDQNVAIIEVAPGPRAQEFVALLTDWGANVTALTSEEYDELTASTQVATHAALIAFGSALKKLGYDIESALPIATPPHRIVLYLLARILIANPEVYWEIQHGYPLAGKVRRALAESIEELDQASASSSPEDFARLLEAIRKTLGPETVRLAKNCADVFQHERLSLRTGHD